MDQDVGGIVICSVRYTAHIFSRMVRTGSDDLRCCSALMLLDIMWTQLMLYSFGLWTRKMQFNFRSANKTKKRKESIIQIITAICARFCRWSWTYFVWKWRTKIITPDGFCVIWNTGKPLHLITCLKSNVDNGAVVKGVADERCHGGAVESNELTRKRRC